MSKVIEKSVADLMNQSYLDYAMSVIRGRALPDVRDGLKPVHRRVLYAMYELSNDWNKPYKKAARIVGDVMGKFHPHGDNSIYDATVRMAQDFSMLHPLIDGQGNFGSIDGDSAAAMRYTEVRLSRIAGEFFSDIQKETISWRPNYDGKEQEPEMLPVPFPHLLVNGGSGIAVGMAYSVAPHNLRAVVEATNVLMTTPDASTAEIVGILKAPDFPTGAQVHGLDGFADAVETGRGSVKIRSLWHEEERRGGGSLLVIDALPYQVNKAKLVKHIAELVSKARERLADKKKTPDIAKDGWSQDIVGLQDESSKEGIRIAISLKRDVSPETMFSILCSKTELEVSFSYNCTVIVDGCPRVLGLKALILEWIKFRQEVVLARHIFERKQALVQLHTLEGYLAALGMLDQTISTIRGAIDPSAAKQELMALLSVDDGQAQSILSLRLQKLTGMEIESIREEHAATVSKVAALTQIIESPVKIREIITAELDDIAKRYGSDRKTEIGHGISDVTREDLIPREDVLIAMTRAGYIKRMPVSALTRQNRGTRGKKAMEIGDDDTVNFMQQAHSHDSLMVFARSGQVYGIKAYRIPEGTVTQKGRHVKNVIDGLDEDISTVLALPEHDPERSVLTVTKSGQVKRTSIKDYDGATRRGGIRGVDLAEGDQLLAAFAVRESDHIILVSNTGQAIRFKVSDARVMGRVAGGVRGMKLDDGEFLVGAAVIAGGEQPGLFLLCIGEKGVGKRTPVSDFPVQGRAGGGVIAFNINSKTGKLVAAMGVEVTEDLIMFASNGVSNRISVPDVRETGRSAAGVNLMAVDEGETLVSVTTTLRGEEDPASAESAAAETATMTSAAPASGAVSDSTAPVEAATPEPSSSDAPSDDAPDTAPDGDPTA